MLRTANATRGGLLSRRDPRVVIFWYLLFAIVPWLTFNITILAILFAITEVAVALSRAGPLVLELFVISLGMESIYLLAPAWLFDGDLNTVMSMLSFGVGYGYRMLPIMID